MLRLVIALVFILSISNPVFSHGDLHQRIAEVSKKIALDPTNGDLYLKRAELHRAHRDWRAALADYTRASKFKPQLTAVDLGRGLTWLAAGKPQAAKEALDRFLGKHAGHALGHATRARAAVAVGDAVSAGRDFDRAISGDPKPEYYVERARTLATMGHKDIDAALVGLDEGLQRLGPLVSLQLYAIDLELQRKRYDAALDRVEVLLALPGRKETWLARKGEILEAAGRLAEARDAYAAALAAANTVPDARRHTPAMRQLEGRVRQALERLERTRPKERLQNDYRTIRNDTERSRGQP